MIWNSRPKELKMYASNFVFLIFFILTVHLYAVSSKRGTWVKLNEDLWLNLFMPNDNVTKTQAESYCALEQAKIADLGEVGGYLMPMNVTGRFWIQLSSLKICSNTSEAYILIANKSNLFGECIAIKVGGGNITLEALSCNGTANYICQRDRNVTEWSEWSNCSSLCSGYQNRTMIMSNGTTINESKPCFSSDCSIMKFTETSLVSPSKFETTSLTTTAPTTTNLITAADLTTTTFRPTTIVIQKTTSTIFSTDASKGASQTSAAITSGNPVNCSQDWAFDGGSFVVGFILVLLPLIALAVKHYLLWKQINSKEPGNHYHDIDDSVKNVEQTSINTKNEYFIANNVGKEHRLHYENVEERIECTFANKQSYENVRLDNDNAEFQPYEPVHQRNKDDEDENGYITRPESIPQQTNGKFDGYENPIALKNPKMENESTSGYVAMAIDSKQFINNAALESAKALVPQKKTNAKTPNVTMNDRIPQFKPQTIAMKPVSMKPPGDFRMELNNDKNNKTDQSAQDTKANPFKVALKPVGQSLLSPTSNSTNFPVKEPMKQALKPVAKPNSKVMNSPKSRSSLDTIADVRKALNPVKK